MTIIQSGLRLPINPVLTTLLLHDIQHSSPSNKSTSNAVILNYYDPYYSPESGGYHPVEIRLFQLDNEWCFDYITDFAYMGTIYPELEKEFDVCWSQGYLYHAALGDIDERAGDAFFKLWQENFIQYHKMGCYTLRIEWQHD
ncbi:DUF2787 domain-containing protein [Proteus vulgaris]|uniref:DUF2787 domain-containing protein n=1 Tax=Proteus vulgaris TaxID=585 RepID=UPI0021B0C1A0|nr:DUF2787 domain-containing protein [Proteus vulgaris]MCT6519175.1 DUF2787 domain-containing protein [Proteus vulgaris]